MKFIFLTLTLASAGAFASIDCKAVHEKLNQGKLESTEAPLKNKEGNIGSMTSLEADLDSLYFSYRGDERQSLVFITEGPDYTKGVAVNASFDETGALRVSRVNGSETYRLQCQRH